MKNAVKTILKITFLAWISIQGATAQPLKIQQNDLWKAMLQQWFILKYTAPDLTRQKMELAAPPLRIDLSMQDIIDQVNLIIAKHFSATDYAQQLAIPEPLLHFDLWYQKLNELSDQDPAFQKQLNHHLVLQQYGLSGVALTNGIGRFKLARIRHLEQYNKIARNPEGPGILFRLGKGRLLTVARVNELSKNEIETAEYEQYLEYQKEMLRLEGENGTIRLPRKIGNPLRLFRGASDRFVTPIFNALEKLPEKHQFIDAIDAEMNHTLPRTTAGVPVLTPSFMETHEAELQTIIKDLTWKKQLSELDDETLFEFRKWMKHHREEVRETLSAYNQANHTELTLDWLDHRGMPHRAEAIESYETLQTIYSGKEPWQDEVSTIMRNRHGNEVVVNRTQVGGIIRRVGTFMRNFVKSENLVAIAAGTGAFFLSYGNLALAMTADTVVHDVIVNRKYDHDPKELLTELPKDVLNGFLVQSGVQPGRIFNVIALGASEGMLQGFLTRQDPWKSALVGATLEVGLEAIPGNIRYPVLNGLSRDVLLQNAAIEIITTSAKTSFRGGVVAILEKKDFAKGMEKGAIYGAGGAVLKIIVLGARYNPLHGYTDEEIQTSTAEENAYDNAEGAPGGNYHVNKEMIQGTPYRAGGWLPVKLDASITLPGNISMNAEQTEDIDVVVHEAHHLSQQEQLGLFRFYFKYILESQNVSYEHLSFEISPH